MAEDNDTFAAEMAKAGITPLKKRQGKVMLPTARPGLRKQVARTVIPDPLSQHDLDDDQEIEWLGPHDIVEYKRPGVQHQVLKKLKLGRNDIGADLDLHGYRIEEARAALFQFINDCVKHRIRYAIIVHGKGWHAQREKDDQTDIHKSVARLKSYTVCWLKNTDLVQAFSSAQAKDGGTGALYVLFKSAPR